MNEIMFEILLIVVSVCVILITRTVIPFLKEQLKDSKYNNFLDEIDKAVRAAKQSPYVKPIGTEKKSYVTKYMAEWLERNNMKITASQLDMLIEAAVYSMKLDEDKERV